MPRLRRWAKRLGAALLELIAVLTVASVVYNAATAHRVKPATALYAGPFVHVNGKLLAYRRWGARDTVDAVPAGRRSARALRAPFHLLAGAGHLSMLAAPNAIARIVDSFARG